MIKLVMDGELACYTRGRNARIVKWLGKEGVYMSDHYYSEQPASTSNRYSFTESLCGKEFSFTSDAGVFSKGGIDFGSRLLIEELSLPKTAGDILDVGCGYGPIGLVIASLNKRRHVYMIDVNERALFLAKENTAQNDVHNVTIMQSDQLQHVMDNRFALVVTNPPIRAGKSVVHGIFEQSADVLVNGGELWVVIQKKQGAPSAEKKLRTLFQSVEIVTRKKGYFILRCVKA